MIKHILAMAVSSSLLMACSKSLSTGDANFGVNINTTEANLGDTTRFSFTGNPDVITFYSGEVGKRYEYRNRYTAAGKPVLRFRTIRANGAQEGSLAVMVSNNFEGVDIVDTPATHNRLAAATWQDISGRATLSTGAAAAVVSGDIDLSDFSAGNKPVYIAFRYLGMAGTVQNKWTIDSFTVKNVLPDGTAYTIANMNLGNTSYTNYGVNTFSPGFAAFRPVNTYYWNIGTTSLVITGATSAAAAAPAEAWALIGPINLQKVTPDVGVVVKSVVQKADELTVSYKYPALGTYQAVFAGGRVSAEESDYTTRSFQITIK